MMRLMLLIERKNDLSSDERKAQVREAQKRYREKQKLQGRTPQPFLLSQVDHDNIDAIKESVDSVTSKDSAISYALKEAVKNLPEKS